MGVQLPSEPITRKEQYLAKAAGQAVEIPAEPITREEAYLEAIANAGGGGGGTTNYNQLSNKPQIAGTTLQGNKTLSDLGIASESALANKVDKVDGKDLSSNDYSDTEKQKNADNATAISAIKDGAIIDSFADVESALSNKQDTLTFDDVPTTNSNNPVKSGGVKSAIDAAVASAYHHAGTKTCAELVAGLLVAGNEGNVYNMTDSGTTTADFIEGAGQPIKAGDNVGIAKISDDVYKFDLLSGFVDTSNFVQKSATAGLLKNDGTVNDEIEGDVDSLKSGFTNLDNEVNGDATVYPYADVITIEDAIPANLADCNVKIEPDQDLHGQSAPYVGGAGRQKLPLDLALLKILNTSGTWVDNVYTLNNVAFTVNLDGGGNAVSIKSNGTASAKTIFYLGIFADFLTVDTSYIINSNIYPESDQGAVLQILKANDAGYVSLTEPYSFTYASEGNAQKLVIRVDNATTANNNVFTPMLRLATETDATFAPYTNICPISGHTEVDAKRFGANLYAGGAFLKTAGNWYSDNILQRPAASDLTITSNKVSGTAGSYRWIAFPFEFKKDVKVYCVTTLSEISASRVFNSSGTQVSSLSGGYTPSEDFSGYIGIGINDGTYDFYFGVGLNSNLDVTHEPSKLQTYTIALGDTIYGGTVDFNTGVMTVDRASVDMGTLSWSTRNTDTADVYRMAANVSPAPKPAESSSATANIKCSIYKRGTNNDTYNKKNGTVAIGTAGLLTVYDERYTGLNDASAFTSAVNGQTICYELATPTTIQLTPQQIQLLKGTNTLTASTGQISVTANGVSGAIGSLQSEVNSVTEGNYKTLVKITADGVKTFSQLLSELYPYITGTIARKYRILLDRSMFEMTQKIDNHISFAQTLNYNGGVYIVSMDIKSNNTADYITISYASDGTATVTDNSSTVPSSGVVIKLVV